MTASAEGGLSETDKTAEDQILAESPKKYAEADAGADISKV
jgi:hypothetical protein